VRALFSTTLWLAVAASATAQAPIYLDSSEEIGLDFVHWNGMTGQYYYSEMMGGGAALFDYDGDGDLDVYLVQGSLQGPEDSMDDALVPFPGPGDVPRDRLYRNDLVRVGEGDGRLRPRLVDVTTESRIDARGYGMGLAVGDVDGNGFPDLYVANFGANELWMNQGDGTFIEAAVAAGVDDPRWSTAATLFDADDDGDLDLHVVSYVVYSVAENPRCFATSSRRDYCGPSSFEGMSDRLYENRGDGTFADVSRASGIDRAKGPGLGVVAADFDGDGRTDLYVTNDGAENFLWLNRTADEGADGLKFVDEALLAGVAVNQEGAPEASMGVDAADFDDDGDLDLFMTHLAAESNTLYENAGGGLFEDRSSRTGLAAPSLPYTSFGTVFTDADNDGRLDLAVASGAVRILEELVRAGDSYPLHQPNQFFLQVAGSDRARFEDATARAGDGFTRSEVSRALAEGDLDLDGDADLLLANNQGPARWLENRVGQDRPSLAVALPAGALEVIFEPAGEDLPARHLHRRSRVDGSYATAHDPKILVGLGDGAPVRELRLAPRRSGGAPFVVRGLTLDRSLVLVFPETAP
jgi:hypothetical protein